MRVIENRVAFSTLELVNIGASKNTLDSGAKRNKKSNGSFYTHKKEGGERHFYYDGLPFELQNLINSKLFEGNTPDDLPIKKLPSLLSTSQTASETPTKQHHSTKLKTFESNLMRKDCDIKVLQSYRVGNKFLPFKTILRA